MKSFPRTLKAVETVRQIYRRLSRAWGPQNWWPADSPFEVVVGAILTQNTSWTNVEKALANLREAGVLSIAGMRGLTIPELEGLIRSSGYFRQKAARLKGFVEFVDANFGGSLKALLDQPAVLLREQLLGLKGIGPETADSILLYAGQHEVFVVDTYTRRVLERHAAIGPKATYEQIRKLVEDALDSETPAGNESDGLSERRPSAHPPSAMSEASRTALAQIFNEMHGLFVQVGKHYCWKSNPGCEACPLGNLLKPPVGARKPVHKKILAG